MRRWQVAKVVFVLWVHRGFVIGVAENGFECSEKAGEETKRSDDSEGCEIFE